jgi:hypothetical protein
VCDEKDSLAFQGTNDRIGSLAAAQYEWLDNQPAGSPIADANHDALSMVGMLYEW